MKQLVLLTVVVLALAATGYAQQWVSQPSGTTQDLYGVSFINPDTGWADGDYGTIVHTTNGGVSWSSQTSGTTLDLRDVKFTNSLLGWAVGAGGTILHTTDGGANWSPQTSGTTQLLWRCHFPDSMNGWAVGRNRTVLHTTDGGLNWSAQTDFSGSVPATTEFKSVWACDSRTAWACAKSGVIIKTTDGGNLWVRKTSGTTMNMNGICFPVDSSEGWAGGKWGQILHTSDGGESWGIQVDNLYTECLMGGVSFTDNQHGWGVGKYGRIVSTFDGGAGTVGGEYGTYPDSGWVMEVDRSDPTRNLRGLHAVTQDSKFYVWATGQLGTILHQATPPPPPTMVCILSGGQNKSSSGDISLDWENISTADYYEVYRDTTSSFSSESVALLDTTSASEYLDPGVVGDTATNYYYLLKTVDVRGFKSGDSNVAGEFDKFILGGL
jgi:photosystem II stability/assembly factor-like uncharacterized protein